MPVIAFKKGRKQIFSDLAWKLLGSNKEGWVELPSQQVVNEVKIEAPYMGPPITKTQIVSNELGKTDEELLDSISVIKNEPKKDSSKEEFLKALDGIGKSRIKEFFELQKPAVEYNNKASLIELKELLSSTLGHNLVKLQKSFS